MTTVEADVVTVLDTCRQFPGVPSSDELYWAAGLTRERLWDATRIISNTRLIKPPDRDGIIWPSNKAVLARINQ